MSEKDTSQNYWASVVSIAQDALDECEVKTQEDYETHRDNVTEHIDESVDSSYWVTYYHAAFKTMEFTENDNAYIEDFGGDLSGCNSFNDVVTKFAYSALQRDVCDRLAQLVEELPETEEEIEEEEEVETA